MLRIWDMPTATGRTPWPKQVGSTLSRGEGTRLATASYISSRLGTLHSRSQWPEGSALKGCPAHGTRSPSGAIAGDAVDRKTCHCAMTVCGIPYGGDLRRLHCDMAGGFICPRPTGKFPFATENWTYMPNVYIKTLHAAPRELARLASEQINFHYFRQHSIQCILIVHIQPPIRDGDFVCA